MSDDSAVLETNADDFLPSVTKLDKYSQSENIFNRQMVARSVLETLRAVVDTPEDVAPVLNIAKRLADDTEPSVRAGLMEQVPHIAMFCHEYRDRLDYVMPHHLLPMVVKFLTDTNNQARKTSQAALLVLLEQGLVDRKDVEEQVCPVILKLTEPDSLDDYRTEAVALMSKMAPLIGREMCARLCLERFSALCTDPLFHVRKVCAANFGDFCGVVGTHATEHVLLQKYFSLCEDGVWGVRKACAEVFMPVSCACSLPVRKVKLSPIFINLLRDQSRWVRAAAFQALGPFISTFADPSITGICHNENEMVLRTNQETLDTRLTGDNLMTSDSGNMKIPAQSSKSQEVQQPALDLAGADTEDSLTSSVISNENDFVNKYVNCSSQTDINPSNELVDMELESLLEVSDSVTPQNVPASEDGCEMSYEEKHAKAYLQRMGHNTDEESRRTGFASVGNQQGCSRAVLDSEGSVVAETTEPENSVTKDSYLCISKIVECAGPDKNITVKNSLRWHQPTKSQQSDVDLHGHQHTHVDGGENSFNTFQFWRVPIPDLQIGIDIAEEKTTDIHGTAKDQNENAHKTVASEINLYVPTDQVSEEKMNTLGTSSIEFELEALADWLQSSIMQDVSPESKARSSGIMAEDKSTSGIQKEQVYSGNQDISSNTLTVQAHGSANKDNSDTLSLQSQDSSSIDTNLHALAVQSEDSSSVAVMSQSSSPKGSPEGGVQVYNSKTETMAVILRNEDSVLSLPSFESQMFEYEATETEVEIPGRQLEEGDSCTELNRDIESCEKPEVCQQANQAQVYMTSVSLETKAEKEELENTEAGETSAGKAVVSVTEEEDTDVKRSHLDLYSPDGDQSLLLPSSTLKLKSAPTLLLTGPFKKYTSSSEATIRRRSSEPQRTSTSKFNQEIVPQLLIDHYISMTDPFCAQTVDNEIARHCAFSLPAVALTLGRKNWPLLKATYETLASDMQWKVRHTLASSIHELAMILGEDLATQDLIPVFNGFIKDLDEVRIGILKHLADFLKLLKPDERVEYLPKLSEFLKTDNDRNWRFRMELTVQLLPILLLFSPLDVKLYLVPIALVLVCDKVAEVRQIAFTVISGMINHLSSSPEPSLVKGCLTDLVEQFAHSKKWVRRQSFVFLCQHFIMDQSLPVEQFAKDVLPHLLDLTQDPVPNIRLAVARVLSQFIRPLAYFCSKQNPYKELLIEALVELQADKDRDVRYFAFLPPQERRCSTTLLHQLTEMTDNIGIFY